MKYTRVTLLCVGLLAVCSVTANHDKHKFNRLMKAIDSKDVNEVTKLVKEGGFDINRTGHTYASGRKSVTPLQNAVMNGDIEVVRAVLQSPGIDVEETGTYEIKPIVYAAQYLDNPDIVQLIVEKNKDSLQALTQWYNSLGNKSRKLYDSLAK